VRSSLGAGAEALELCDALGTEWGGVEVAVVLGSGLSQAAASLEIRREANYRSLPGLGAARVAGHAGRLLRGRLRGTEVLAFLGRRHVYEGIPPAQAALPARLAAALGARLLVTLSAVGAVDPLLPLGSWVFLEDHLNLMGRNPLEGVETDEGPAFVDLSATYRTDLFEPLAEGLRKRGLRVSRGVLAAFSGPSYETPAEVRMARLLGASVVGMSTVPEAVWARHLEMDVLAWGRVANPAAGLSSAPLEHREVVERMGEHPEEAEAVLEECVSVWRGELETSGTLRSGD
jgi:purine-nucleoside phosphorylase